MSLTLRPLDFDDLAVLTRWLNAGTVLAWYGGTPKSEDEVAAKYGPRIRGEVPTHCYIALMDDEMVGYGQWYRLADYPDYARQIEAPPDAAGLDLFIADPWQRRGWSEGLIAELLFTIAQNAPDLRYAIAAPDARNERSLNAFRRAGFTFHGSAEVEGETGPCQVLIRSLPEPSED